MAVTVKSWQIDEAPRRIELLGDKTMRPESAQHIIEFPGGAIELSRLDNGDYWAYIIINRRWVVGDIPGLYNRIGEVVGSRMTVFRQGVVDLPCDAECEQIAVLIRPTEIER